MKVVSFFAGCGGLDLGFEQAGFRVIWANELEPAVRDTYIQNHPHTEFILGDINRINPKDVPSCDGFIGGPPCQSWSIAGKQKGLEDERGKLFLTYIKMIRAKKPKFFLIENVKGLLEEKFSKIFYDFLKQLDNAGYNVKWQLLDAVNFGIPQNRERVFIIGFRKDLNVKYDFPKGTYSTPIPLIHAIGDIKETPITYKETDKVTANQKCANHDVLISNFNMFYHKGNRRRGWLQPSFTIHATGDSIPLHPSSPKMLFFGHENWDFQKDKINKYRRLSVRECARIQTFPDNFVFVTNNIKVAYKMIGNAVPPRLGLAIATSIISALKNIQVKQLAKKEYHSTEECILVGYFKNAKHHDCIIKNRLYNVRSDGRFGSIFKEDCDIIPKYLLLHHNELVEIYELKAEEPTLTDASYLRKLGFECQGQTYLCFHLQDGLKKTTQELGGNTIHPIYNNRSYTPYFTTFKKLIN